MRISILRPGAVQFAKYLIFAGIASGVNFGLGVLSYGYLGFQNGVQYQGSVTVAYVAGMIVNFLLNRTFTFPSRERTAPHQLRTFFVVSMGGLLLTVVLASAFRFGLRVVLEALAPEFQRHGRGLLDPNAIGHLMAIGLVAIYSFLGHKHLTFRRGIRAGLRDFGTRARNYMPPN